MVLATGKDWDEIGRWTPDQLIALQRAVIRNYRRVYGVPGDEDKGDDEALAASTTAFENRVRMMKGLLNRDTITLDEAILGPRA